MLGEAGSSGVNWVIASVTTKPKNRTAGRLFVTPRPHTYPLVCLEMHHGHGLAETQRGWVAYLRPASPYPAGTKVSNLSRQTLIETPNLQEQESELGVSALV